MLIKVIDGFNHCYGKTDDYLALRVLMVPNETWGAIQYSAWEPTPTELARLNAGAHVILGVCGLSHPPVSIQVGEVPASPKEGENLDG